MQKIFDWLVYSSTNADKWGMTIKGLATFIPSAVILLGFVHVHLDPNDASGFIDSLVVFVTSLGSLIGALATVIGFVRKVQSTYLGRNDVLNKYY